jgi:hypothetical protein
MKKGQLFHKLTRRMEINNICGAIMSPYADNFIGMIHQIQT